MPSPSVSAEGRSRLSAYLKELASSGSYPAVFAGITTAEATIFLDQSGDRVYGQPDKGQVSADTPTEIWSQTKLVTQVAALQLVDKGKVSLDDADELERLLPELAGLPLLRGYDDDGTPILVERTRKPTLRMLLSHTSGQSYVFADPFLTKYAESHPEVAGMSFLKDTSSVKSLALPFVCEPGTSFRYSIGLDWAGLVVERVSGQRLEEYFQEHIFKPCGITTMTFYPSTKLSETKMAMCYRKPDGGIMVSPDGWSLNRPREESVIRKVELLAGGAGLFGTQKDYLAFLRGILRSDPKVPGDGLLSPEGFTELFTSSLPTGEGSTGHEALFQFFDERGYRTPDITGPQDVDYSVGGLLNLRCSANHRKLKSLAWSGIAKTQFWMDPTTGIAAVFGTQLIAQGPDPWTNEYYKYEGLVYEALEGADPAKL